MADEVSRDELAAAWDVEQPADEPAAEETPTEEKETKEHDWGEEPAPEIDEGKEEPEKEEEPPEPEDNAERSKLGRKVAALESTIQELTSFIRQMQQKPTEPEDEFDEDEPLTKKKFEELLELHNQRQHERQSAYTQQYQRILIRAGLEMDEHEHADIINAIERLPSRARTGNPELDAKIDFREAENALLREKVKGASKPKNPLNKNKDTEPEAPLGGGAETGNDSRPRQMPKLDKAAMDFVKSRGMDADRVNKVLSGEAALNLVNPRGK